MQTTATDLVPADLTDSGQPVSQRIPECEQAVSIALNLIQLDITRANRRQKVQGYFDGNAPRTTAQMQQAGRGDDSNINWKEFKGNISNAWNPFFDLVSEVPVCIDGDLEAFGSDIDQQLMRGFAEYFHDMCFAWPGFDNMNQLRDQQMLLHGVGVLVWEDEYMPFPEPILASDFYVNQRAKCTFDNLDFAMVTSDLSVGQLWRQIAGLTPEQVTATKWDSEAIKAAIMNATSIPDLQTMGKRWDRWEQMFKNGDLYVSDNCKEIKTATMFVNEMDAKITQLCFTYQESVQTNNNFLYKNVSKYDSWDQCICVFFYDIGADGTFYSVKGLGTEIYPFCALSNKIKNSIADLVAVGIKPMFQPASGTKIEDYQMVKMGGFNMVPSGLAKLDLDIGRSIQPALEVSRDFSQTNAQNTGAYSQSDIAPPTVDETAKAAMIRASERAKLTKGAHNRFYRSLDGQYREIWRRVTRKDLQPHQLAKNKKVRDLVMEFRDNCEALCAKLDVPNGALQAVKNIRATRSIGLGSPAMRIEIASAIMEKWPNLPTEQAKNNALRAYFSAITSYANVDSFAPPLNEQPKTSQDAWDATMENDGLNNGGEALLTPTQNPVIHLQTHIASSERDMEAVQNQQMEPQMGVSRIHSKGVHSWEHMALLQGNPARQQEYKDFAGRLQQLAAFQDQVEQQLEAQAKAAGQNQPQQQPDPDLVKVQGTLQLKQDKQHGDMAIKVQKQQFDEAQRLRKQQFDEQERVREQQFNQSLRAHQVVADTTLDAAQTAANIHLDAASKTATNGATP